MAQLRRGGQIGTAAVALACALVVASARAAAPSVYVADDTSNAISQYNVGSGGVLSPKTNPLAPTVGSQFPIAIALTPAGTSAYVADSMSPGNVYEFNVAANGSLTPKATHSIAAGSYTQGVAVSPNGKFVFAAASGSNAVFQFKVGSGGELAAQAPASVAAGSHPDAVAVSPNGSSVYVADFNAGTISQYDVGASGVVAPKAPATVATGAGPGSISVSPNGKNVYVATYDSSSVWQYTVGAGGKLAPKSPSHVVAGSQETAVAVSPNGANVYVAEGANPGTTEELSVAANGTLTVKSPPSVAAGGYPQGVALSPNGASVYVSNEGSGGGAGSVSQYNRGSGGGLSKKSPATVPAGDAAVGVTVSPDQGPKAAFTWNPNAPGSSTSFNGSASSDPDGTVVRYDWTFGDGVTVTDGGPTPTHIYATSGFYTVTLRVYDNAGCSTAFVFTGQTASCNGSSAAVASHTVTIT